MGKKLVVHGPTAISSSNACGSGYSGHIAFPGGGKCSECSAIHKKVTCEFCLDMAKQGLVVWKIKPKIVVASLPEGFSMKQLTDDSYGRSVRKGWYTGVEFNIPEKLALIHSEVSEALEDHRNNRMGTTVNEKGKTEGFPTELADIIIRVADLAGKLGIDLDTEIRRKAAFNETRPYRHGQKVC